MIEGKRLVVVMPAYNAERTLRQTFKEIPWDWVDEVLLVDDHSEDGTVALARQLGIRTFVHAANRAMLGLYVDVRAAEGVEQELLAGHGVVVAIQQAPPTEVMVEVFCGHAVETVHPGF